MDKQRTGANAHPERDFSYLQDKSPVELIAEMEDLISEMSAEDFDNEQVQAYLAALRAKTPATADFDPQAHHGGRGGAGGQPQGPQRQAAGGGEVRKF